MYYSNQKEREALAWLHCDFEETLTYESYFKTFFKQDCVIWNHLLVPNIALNSLGGNWYFGGGIPGFPSPLLKLCCAQVPLVTCSKIVALFVVIMFY